LLAVLISGRGSNMRALVEAGLPVSAVLSDRADASGLEFARSRGIPTRVVEHRAHASREAFEAALGRELESFSPRLVALAGFMRVLTPGFVQRYAQRMLNIHPSLLPAFPGLDTHKRALAAGVRLHGCTVHFVRVAVDEGPIIVQAAVPVLAGDDEATLAARVLAAEHRCYPLALKLAAEKRLRVENEHCVIDGAPAQDAVLINPPPLLG
jgi:phosphoribosylglycinamide formyltransferase 1